MFVTILAVSVPIFVAAFTAQFVLGVQLHVVPVAGTSDGWPMSYIVPGSGAGAVQLGHCRPVDPRFVAREPEERVRADCYSQRPAQTLGHW